jgi:hypothetical protein
MIERNVVLVLGAGASAGYGYPLGPGLRGALIGLKQDIVNLVVGAGYEQAAISNFSAEFGASNLASIDVFLERRQTMAELGRAMIAAVILRRDAAANIRGKWYEYLWQQMTQNAPSIDQFAGNRLSIITFNYDTSFERYMVNALRAAYDVSLDAAIKAFSAIRIVHVHGQIPSVRNGAARMLSAAAANSESVRLYRDQIITLHQGQRDSAEFKIAKGWLDEADDVAYLGFGFQSDNMSRLGTEYRCGLRSGTVSGFQAAEIDRIKRMFRTQQPMLFDVDCLTFLRRHATFLG